MSTDTRTPAQAATAGGRGRPPATPHDQGPPKPRAERCPAQSRQTGQRCGMRAGWGTDHVGIGACRFHFGATENHRKRARVIQAAATLAELAIPVEGDPLEALQDAVERSRGYMTAAGALLKAAGKLEEAELYLRAIRECARTAKAASEAFNLDELIRIREREADILEAALLATVERFGIPERRRPAFLQLFREELQAQLPAGAELS